MKIAVFSDIHGNQFALREFLRQSAHEVIDRFYFLGDVFGYYYGQNECFDLLRGLAHLVCIRGNHDEYFLRHEIGEANIAILAKKYGNTYLHMNEIAKENRDFLHTWGQSWREHLGRLEIGFFHGTPDDPVNGRLYPDTEITNAISYRQYDVVFLGHTHHKMKRRIGETLIINPGSLGQQRDGKGCSYILFDTENMDVEWRIVTYDIVPLLRQIDENDPAMPSLKEVLMRSSNKEQENEKL